MVCLRECALLELVELLPLGEGWISEGCSLLTSVSAMRGMRRDLCELTQSLLNSLQWHSRCLQLREPSPCNQAQSLSLMETMKRKERQQTSLMNLLMSFSKKRLQFMSWETGRSAGRRKMKVQVALERVCACNACKCPDSLLSLALHHSVR